MDEIKTQDQLVAMIADIIENNGESILNDSGVDREVCLSIADDVCHTLVGNLDESVALNWDFEHVHAVPCEECGDPSEIDTYHKRRLCLDCYKMVMANKYIGDDHATLG